MLKTAHPAHRFIICPRGRATTGTTHSCLLEWGWKQSASLYTATHIWKTRHTTFSHSHTRTHRRAGGVYAQALTLIAAYTRAKITVKTKHQIISGSFATGRCSQVSAWWPSVSKRQRWLLRSLLFGEFSLGSSFSAGKLSQSWIPRCPQRRVDRTKMVRPQTAEIDVWNCVKLLFDSWHERERGDEWRTCEQQGPCLLARQRRRRMDVASPFANIIGFRWTVAISIFTSYFCVDWIHVKRP